MPIVVASGLVKSYGTRTLLRGVDLSIHDGERIGLVGDNGSGKSTLARILAGLDTPDEGTVATRREATIAYLAQEPALPDDATAHAAVYEGLGEWLTATKEHERVAMAIGAGEIDGDAGSHQLAEIEATIERLGGWSRRHEADAILEALGLGPVTSRCADMSGGERRRVALARLLVSKPRFAVLDEPTNHLDADAIDWLEKYLRDRFEGALLLLTHDRWLLDRLVDETVELDRGKLYVTVGGWDAYLEGKAERIAHEERVESNRQNFLRTEIEWLRRSPAARTTKQRARVDRAESALAERAPEMRRTVDLELDSTRLGKTILDARGLGIVAYGKRIVDAIDFCVRKGERIGLVGPNGAGKTTLLRVLMGEMEPTSGEVVRGENTKFIYLDQNRSGLDPDASLEDNITGGHRRIEVAGKLMDSRAYLGRFMFTVDDAKKKVAALSGGERARVALAKLLMSPANVLVLDEPTNDLDVSMLSSLESLLVEQERTALIVSHDRYFLDRAATAILELDGSGNATLYQGGWDTYVRLRDRARAEAAAALEAKKQAEKSAKAPKASAEKKGLSYKERLELEGLMPKIDALETELAELEAKLADPSTYEGGKDPSVLVARRDALRAEIEAAVERWTDLESRNQT